MLGAKEGRGTGTWLPVFRLGDNTGDTYILIQGGTTPLVQNQVARKSPERGDSPEQGGDSPEQGKEQGGVKGPGSGLKGTGDFWNSSLVRAWPRATGDSFKESLRSGR